MPFLSANNMLIDLPYRSRLFGSRTSFRAPVNQSLIPHDISGTFERVRSSSPEKEDGLSCFEITEETLFVKIFIKNEVVVVQADEKSSTEIILSDLSKALAKCSDEMNRKCVRLELGSRTPERMMIRNIARMLQEKRNLTLVSIRCSKDALRRFASREHRLCFAITEEEPQQAAPAPESLPAPAPRIEKPLEKQELIPQKKESSLKILHRTLRSGTVLKVDHDLIVYGDVNAGAVIEAGGSITVFGALRGAVYAGRAKKNACVMAVTLQPTQLSIGDNRATVKLLQNIPRRWTPAIAHVENGEIVVEDFRRSAVRPEMEM
jgi:septum site-determining protein MinC